MKSDWPLRTNCSSGHQIPVLNEHAPHDGHTLAQEGLNDGCDILEPAPHHVDIINEDCKREQSWEFTHVSKSPTPSVPRLIPRCSKTCQVPGGTTKPIEWPVQTILADIWLARKYLGSLNDGVGDDVQEWNSMIPQSLGLPSNQLPVSVLHAI